MCIYDKNNREDLRKNVTIVKYEKNQKIPLTKAEEFDIIDKHSSRGQKQRR